ncbi:DNA recombination protein RmuC [Phytoactinopolyspora alkaliphila]|uniref:DNA recombination protein RmuC n=1 Tax=Phytoactinopolyspora alkaliphila TaxID=1783498 RepID=A0A6N9YTA2_9ACTN|nr:DNA recombination protein RmuC [Phytoactinopolyspora alkaliphila]NED98049.1 DNA recombination protein RmuC [Phytoactinopolyspora alkaliphila]
MTAHVFTALAAAVIGLVLGALVVRARAAAELATANARRDAVLAERDTLRADYAALTDRYDDVLRQLQQARGEQARLEVELGHARADTEDKLDLLRREQDRFGHEFERLSAAALRQNRDEFLQLAAERFKNVTGELDQRHTAVEALVKPLNEQLDKVTDHVHALEKARTQAYTELRAQMETMGRSSEQLRLETQQLVSALRAPQVRGRWGELQLRRVVEAAGMLEHVDFTEQTSVMTVDGRLRPDMLVKLAGGKNIVVDAKVAFSGFLEAQEARDEAARAKRLAAHARHLRDHIEGLARKEYWEQFSPSPEFVVMFVPSDVFLNAAMEQDPSLYEFAFERNVVLTTPGTLVALLRTVAYTWRQEALAANAQQVLTLGRELHSRLATMGGHMGKLGRQLDGAVSAYNSTVSSLESRVLVTARKLADLKVVDNQLESPDQVDRAARHIQAPELAAAADQALVTVEDIDRRYGIDVGASEGLASENRAKDGTDG